tara:strand:+ start:393 stop:1337 length:945 start_codon:yes stop_codon:yes gene_type:complete
MVWNFVAQGLWHGGRWALTRAAPSVLNAGRSLLSKKLTVGSTLALTAATSPTLWSALDNSTGNALSETLLKTPVGPAVEKLLEVDEWSKDQKATVVSNLIDSHLESKGHLDPNADNYERSKRMTEALGHIIVGDEIGAASIASDLGIQTSDIVESYNRAKTANPDATIQEVGKASFLNLREKLDHQQELQASRELATTPETTQSIPSISPSRQNNFNLDSLSDDKISDIFNAAMDKEGFMGFVNKGISFFAGFIGLKRTFEASVVSKILLNPEQTEAKVAALQKAQQNGMVVSRMGNRFGLGDMGPSYQPELAS